MSADAIAAWAGEELVDPALRPVAEESLHITLAFLGYLPEKRIPQLAEIAAAGAGPAARIELGGPVPRPPRGRPRLFALPAESRTRSPSRPACRRGWSRPGSTSPRSARSGPM